MRNACTKQLAAAKRVRKEANKTFWKIAEKGWTKANSHVSVRAMMAAGKAVDAATRGSCKAATGLLTKAKRSLRAAKAMAR